MPGDRGKSKKTRRISLNRAGYQEWIRKPTMRIPIKPGGLATLQELLKRDLIMVMMFPIFVKHIHYSNIVLVMHLSCGKRMTSSFCQSEIKGPHLSYSTWAAFVFTFVTKQQD